MARSDCVDNKGVQALRRSCAPGWVAKEQPVGCWSSAGALTDPAADAGAGLCSCPANTTAEPHSTSQQHQHRSYISHFVLPAFFSSTSGKNSIPINGNPSAINCPNLYCLCSAENSVRTFKCFVPKKTHPKLKLRKPLHVKFIFARYEFFRIFQFQKKKTLEICLATICRQT